MQNETVDHVASRFSLLADEFTEYMGIGPKLVLRVRSPETELGLVLALIRPSFDFQSDLRPLSELNGHDLLIRPVSESLH